MILELNIIQKHEYHATQPLKLTFRTKCLANLKDVKPNNKVQVLKKQYLKKFPTLTLLSQLR